jgi:hypothetical protein
MSEIEKAIKHFEEAIEKDTDFPASAAFWGQRKLNYTIALVALREKQKHVQLKPQTNADYIRNMTDEELEDFLNSVQCGNCKRRMNNCFPAGFGVWLKKPVKEEKS